VILFALVVGVWVSVLGRVVILCIWNGVSAFCLLISEGSLFTSMVAFVSL
jgi:hypothetical protein